VRQQVRGLYLGACWVHPGARSKLLAALSDGQVIGTLRIMHQERTAKIGRMALLASARKKGIGSELMECAAATASRAGADEIILGAQLAARNFTNDVEEGADLFDDAGIPHVMMRKMLGRNQASR